MEPSANDISTHLKQACLRHERTLADYCRIAIASKLSDQDADQLADIYDQAASDPWLDFLINQLDYFLNQRIGLFSDKHVHSFDDQQAWLREHLQEVPRDVEDRKKMQALLKEFKYYLGPIDGVLGKRSKKAIEKLHKQAQKSLAEKGFYHNKIDGIFAEFSISAVKEFQKAENLKDDGVLGRETLVRLMQ